jgi:uncharacterized protein
VHVVLHGGEPLLLGEERTRGVLEILRREIAPVTSLVMRMHTNGVLLSESYLDLLAEYDVKVGVSLDGGRAANDLHRLDRRGNSSYDRVVKALDLLRAPAYRHLYSGLLCTIDIQNDPVEAYRALIEQEPPRIDFLLPHATWEHQPFGLPARRDRTRAKDGAAPYAHWLGKIFAVWEQEGRPVPVRTFDSVLAALHGRPSGTESLGLAPADLLVIETDGSLEQADWLKTAYEGAAATGFDVFRNSLDQAALHTGIMARQHGLDDLCDACRQCPVVAVCGGGLYAHRYDPATGFDNPSVYCADLVELIGRISRAEGMHGPAGSPGAAAVANPVAHTLGRAQFDALAAGYGGAAAIGALAEAQRSIRRGLMARLAQTGPQQDGRFSAGWDQLAALDEVCPEAVDRALAHPHVRAWAVRCLADPAFPDAAQLAGVAVRARMEADCGAVLVVPARDGLVHLPGLGALSAPPGAPDLVVEVLSSRQLIVTGGGQAHKIDLTEPGGHPLWRPSRRVQAAGLAVLLEDLDPERRCHPGAAPRLTEAEYARWQAAFTAAVAFVDEYLPGHAQGLRAGLASVVPLLPAADGSLRGGAVRHAFGAVAAALPQDPILLGLLLVRGFQQVKLGALLDLCDLYDTEDTRSRHYAPWSSAPESLEALLQGTYMRVAEAEFWRARRALLSGAAGAAAETRFCRSREEAAAGVHQLLDSGSLTVLGEQFVRTLGETVTPWLAEAVSRQAAVSAQRSGAEHRAGYDEQLRTTR